MRLQDTYKLDPETLSRGNLPGKCTKVSSLKRRKQTSSNTQSPFSVVMKDYGSETVQLRHLWLCLFWCFENSLEVGPTQAGEPRSAVTSSSSMCFISIVLKGNIDYFFCNHHTKATDRLACAAYCVGE